MACIILSNPSLKKQQPQNFCQINSEQYGLGFVEGLDVVFPIPKPRRLTLIN